VPLPDLTPGLVVRYEYRWARRPSTANRRDKDHPACVIAAFRKTGHDEDFVVYLPISHTPPSGDEVGVELPDATKARAGPDDSRQWVLVSECNIDAWPFDIRQIPYKPGRYHYGYLPPAVFAEIRDRFSELYRAKRVRQVIPTSLEINR
jgi:hypothetical protein